MAQETTKDCSPSASGGMSSLRVEPGEQVVLSPDSPRFSGYYKQVRPRTIDEVRQVIGLSDESVKTLANRRCCKPSTVSSTLISPDDLESEDPAAKSNARAAVYQAGREYVHGDPTLLTQWKPALDRYVEINKALLNVLDLLKMNIEVADGATLVISNNTHAVYAGAVRIHGSGRIVCQGSVTFKIDSLAGIANVTSIAGQRSIDASKLLRPGS